MPWTRLRVFLTAFIWTLAFLIGILLGAFVRLQYGLPKASDLQQYRPLVSTRLFDLRGQVIADFSTQRRDPVELRMIPAYIREGIVAVEDKRFYRHSGFDFVRLFGTVFYNIKALRIVAGGSTITQQLARNMFLTMEQTLDRKLKEALLTIEIERAFAKDEILELYLNQVYFGQGSYGVEAAAQTMFGKSVRSLDLVQCATLCALPANATYYSPYNHPDRLLSRRNLFLRKLLDLGKITKAQYEKAVVQPVKVNPVKSRRNEAPYFVEEIRKYLEETYGPEFVYTSGARVYTTLDLRVQRAANAAIEGRLSAIEKNYKLKPSKREFDSLISRDSTLKAGYLQGALVAIDPKDGGVRAMVGGRSFAQSYFNRAVQAKRQAGSAFKVFVYTAAIDNDRTPDDIEEDSPIRLQQPGGKVYEPKNIDYKFLGPMTLYEALARSRNVVAVRLISEIGPEVVVSYARRMGIKSPLLPYYSLALGACEVSLLEMTSAFGVLANCGMRAQPYYIRKITEPSGRIVEQHSPHTEQVLSEQTAHVMIRMLQGVVDRGTAWSIRANGFYRPAAGKTGTTDDYTDAWFIGFTPELACGVWVGYDAKKTIFHGATGGVVAAPIWADVMKASPVPDRDYFPTQEPIIEPKPSVQDTDIITMLPGAAREQQPDTPARVLPAVPEPIPDEVPGY